MSSLGKNVIELAIVADSILLSKQNESTLLKTFELTGLLGCRMSIAYFGTLLAFSIV